MVKRNIAWILIVCLLLAVLGGFVGTAEYRKHQEKEIFVNNFYFLLKNLHEELTRQDAERLRSSPYLYIILTELDVRCILQAREPFAKFSYPRIGIFEMLRNNIGDGTYAQEEIGELSADLGLMIAALSDESGMHANEDLTYKDLNRVLGDFTEKWINYPY